MIVVIDGYNLLRQVFPRIKIESNKQREQFVYQLGEYKRYRADKIKSIIIVFDGGELEHAVREVHRGITVVFSGYKTTADDWIIEYFERTPDEELILVTMDRGLIKKCKRRNVEVCDVFEFYSIVQQDILQRVKIEVDACANSERQEAHQAVYLSEQSLDVLMQLETKEISLKDDNYEDVRQRKGCSHTLSKKEKKRLEKLKKIW